MSLMILETIFRDSEKSNKIMKMIGRHGQRPKNAKNDGAQKSSAPAPPGSPASLVFSNPNHHTVSWSSFVVNSVMPLHLSAQNCAACSRWSRLSETSTSMNLRLSRPTALQRPTVTAARNMVTGRNRNSEKTQLRVTRKY